MRKKVTKKARKNIIAAILISACCLECFGISGCGKEKTQEAEEITSIPEATSAQAPVQTPTDTAAPTQEPLTEADYAQLEFVSINDINVRSAPGTEADIISSLKKGDRVTVKGEEKDGEDKSWYKVSFSDADGNNIEGYAAKQYINQVHKITERN